MSRYDPVRLDRLHHIASAPGDTNPSATSAAATTTTASNNPAATAPPTSIPTTSYPYDFSSGSHTWNVTTPGVFGGSLAGLAAAAGGSGAMTSHVKPHGRPGRTALPSTWLDQAGLNSSPFSIGSAPGIPAAAAAAAAAAAVHNPHNNPHLLQPAQLRAMTPTPSHHDAASSTGADDELIPTAIVIKNIPFAVKKEQLVQLMTELNLPLPYAFNYHFDNGVFRGLAFANFTSSEETAAVIDVLNHYELHGRKLRVEYKKMLPYHERERIEREKREKRGQLEEQHRPIASHQLHTQPSMTSLPGQMHGGSGAASPAPAPTRNRLEVDMNDPDTLRVYTELFLFKQDLSREFLMFPPTLSPIQRRTVHTLAHNLGLQHSSRGHGADRAVHVFRHPLALGNAPGSATGNAGLSPASAAMSTPGGAGGGSGGHGGGLHPVDGRRGLNRAATIDFSEARAEGVISPFSAAPRTHPSSGFLNVMDSTSFGNIRGGGAVGAGGAGAGGGFGMGAGDGGPQNLRAAKSFADLRSYSPSPALSTSSFPASALQSNLSSSRYGGYDVNVNNAAVAAAAHAAAAAAAANNGSTPNMTPTPSGSSLSAFQRAPTSQEDIFTPLSQLSLGTGLSGMGANSSPRRLRGMFSWDTTDSSGPAVHGQSTPGSSSASPIAGGALATGGATASMSMNGGANNNGAIGSQRNLTGNGAVGTGYDGTQRNVGQSSQQQQQQQQRQGSSSGYQSSSSRTRSSRGSDELRGSGRNGVEIIVE